MADDDANQRPKARDEKDEFGIDQKRMPFTDHLVELRSRIIVCLVTVAAAFLIFFLGFRFQLYELLSRPVRAAGEAVAQKLSEKTGEEVDVRFYALKPYSPFATSAYICLVGAIALTIPVTLYEMWMFVAPGLKRRERSAVRPILLFGTLFFLAGMAFAYTQVVPAAMEFLINDTAKFEGMELRFELASTLKFEMTLLLVFGFAFELPVVICTLTRIGILSPEMVAKRRKMVILLMFVGAALLTPPDVVTQLLLAGPLVILLEISIQAAKFFRPKRTAWDQWEDVEHDETWDEAMAEWDTAIEGDASAPSGPTAGEAPAGQPDEPQADYDEHAEYYSDEHYDDEYYDEGDYGYEQSQEEPPEEGQAPEGELGEEPEQKPQEGDAGDAEPDAPGPPDDELPPEDRMH